MLICLYANNSVKIQLDYFSLRGAKVKMNYNNKTAAEKSTAVKENMNFTDWTSAELTKAAIVLRSAVRAGPWS